MINLELPQPVVKVVSIGSSIAGEPQSLECSVETEAGVRPGDIYISWTTPNGSNLSSSAVLTSEVTSEGTVTRGRLSFSPLATSEAGSYTCTGTIAAESVSSHSSLELSVTSKPSCSTYYSYIISLSVPAPEVSVSVNTGDGPVVQGIQLIMNCSVSVSSSVDTEFSVSISWTSQPERVLSGPSVTISDISSLGHQLHRTVTISPVDLTDSAVYTCTASVSPVIGTAGVMASNESEDSVNITVEGELALYQCLSQMLRFYLLLDAHAHTHTHIHLRANTTNC